MDHLQEPSNIAFRNCTAASARHQLLAEVTSPGSMRGNDDQNELDPTQPYFQSPQHQQGSAGIYSYQDLLALETFNAVTDGNDTSLYYEDTISQIVSLPAGRQTCSYDFCMTSGAKPATDGNTEELIAEPSATRDQDGNKHLVINTGYLHYRDLEAARAIMSERVPLQLDEVDDVYSVKLQAPAYIMQMLAAFDATPDTKPPDEARRDAAHIAYFQAWQAAQHAAMVNKLEFDLLCDQAYVEKRCWLLLQAVVDMHEQGAIRIDDTNTTFKSDLGIKCSDRVEQIIDILRAYTIVRLDVVKYTHIDQLVADPNAYIKRKLNNMAVNHKKQAKKALADPDTPVSQPGAGKKRLRSHITEENDLEEEELCQVRPRKKRAVRAKS